MFMVSDEEATAIRAAFDQGGEFAVAAVSAGRAVQFDRHMHRAGGIGDAAPVESPLGLAGSRASRQRRPDRPQRLDDLPLAVAGMRAGFQIAAGDRVDGVHGTARYGAACGPHVMLAGMLSDAQRGFLEAGRVAHLATADAHGRPHVVPVCYAIADATLYITIDEKPKRQDVPLKRLRNILVNPAVAVTVDRWDEDWTRLAWVMLRGQAEILPDGAEHDHAQALLRARYPQYRTMDLAPLPVIAVRIAQATGWGRLVM
jgi:PPOX class probable F420-dependent enzyme